MTCCSPSRSRRDRRGRRARKSQRGFHVPGGATCIETPRLSRRGRPLPAERQHHHRAEGGRNAGPSEDVGPENRPTGDEGRDQYRDGEGRAGPLGMQHLLIDVSSDRARGHHEQRVNRRHDGRGDRTCSPAGPRLTVKSPSAPHQQRAAKESGQLSLIAGVEESPSRLGLRVRPSLGGRYNRAPLRAS